MSRFRLNIAKLKKLNHNGKILTNVDMSKFCTFRCGGKAKVLLEINTLENFLKIMMYLKDNPIPFCILGAGSNILVSDEGYNGVVLKFGGDLARIEQIEDTVFECGAGVKLSKLFAIASSFGLSGLEDGAGIPATIGGAVFMNASAYNFETAKLVEYVVAYIDGKIEYFDNKNCKFGYRTSVFQKNNAVILRVGLKLVKSDKNAIMDRFYQIAKKRADSQPLKYPSAGCVFKRIDGVQISKLLDEAGFKGLTVGLAQVSHKHANFIINLGGGKSQDIYDLIKIIKSKMKNKYNLDLQTEIKLLGEFE